MAWAEDNGIDIGWEPTDEHEQWGIDSCEVTMLDMYKWQTKDGALIALWDLTDTHIENILRKFPEAHNVRAWRDYKLKGGSEWTK